MGKYLRKAKGSAEVAVVEVSHQSTLGVRTRARDLAAAAAQDSCDYLELRSRRLEKPLLPLPACKGPVKPNPDSCPKANSGSVGTRGCSASEAPPDAEASFGENILEAEARDRETTPCSLIRNPEKILTPGSTNRPTNSRASSRTPQTVHQKIPTAHEMEEFFSRAEQLQHQILIERYNFDPVDDHPLPGKYEWVRD